MIDPQQIDPHQLPSIPLAERSQLPEISGIYFAIDNTKNIQYIGRSQNLNHRWTNHHRLKQLQAIKDVRVAYVEIDAVEYLSEIEQILIEKFEPLLNWTSVRHQPARSSFLAYSLYALSDYVRQEKSFSEEKLKSGQTDDYLIKTLHLMADYIEQERPLKY